LTTSNAYQFTIRQPFQSHVMDSSISSYLKDAALDAMAAEDYIGAQKLLSLLASEGNPVKVTAELQHSKPVQKLSASSQFVNSSKVDEHSMTFWREVILKDFIPLLFKCNRTSFKRAELNNWIISESKIELTKRDWLISDRTVIWKKSVGNALLAMKRDHMISSEHNCQLYTINTARVKG